MNNKVTPIRSGIRFTQTEVDHLADASFAAGELAAMGRLMKMGRVYVVSHQVGEWEFESAVELANLSSTPMDGFHFVFHTPKGAA